MTYLPEIAFMTAGRGPNPRNDAIRALLVRSGNQCAFPGCAHPIVNEKQEFIAQVCHIEAASPGGPRYNPTMTEDQRRAFPNLLLLCYRHHVETDDTAEYPVDILRDMKAQHESRAGVSPIAVTEELVTTVAKEADAYWIQIQRSNSEDHVVPNLRLPIDITATTTTLFHRIRDELQTLGRMHAALYQSAESLPIEVGDTLARLGYDLTQWNDLPYWENPTINRDWELLAIGLTNVLTTLCVLLDQLEIRNLESAVVLHPKDEELRSRLAQIRATARDYSSAIGYVD